MTIKVPQNPTTELNWNSTTKTLEDIDLETSSLVTYNEENENYTTSINLDLSNIPMTLSPNIDIKSNGLYYLGDFDTNKSDLEIKKDETQQRSLVLKKSNEITRDEINNNYSIGSFEVNIQPNLQSKTINYTVPYTPTTITADNGYDGLSSVNFNCESVVIVVGVYGTV